MKSVIIKGGNEIKGEIEVSGSKNAALPLIFASILVKGSSRLSNLPDIGDVNTALLILEYLGATTERRGGEVIINTDNLKYGIPPDFLVSRLRASSYLLGAMTARFKRSEIQCFGGCNFDKRPIDMHLDAVMAVGGEINGKSITAKSLKSTEIHFDKPSVGATINALLLTVTLSGESRIYGYAKEPHVDALIDFLASAGADIKAFPEFIRVRGRELKNAHAVIIPDMIEAGTYSALSLLNGSNLKIKGVALTDLSAFFEFAVHGGAALGYGKRSFSFLTKIDRYTEIETGPYPEFPTDLQPLCAPLMSEYGGEICENVWHRRFGYLAELEKFGLKYKTDQRSAYIMPSALHCARGRALDLRGGAALVITALSVKGESVIEDFETVERGYENMIKKLLNIGCDISLRT